MNKKNMMRKTLILGVFSLLVCLQGFAQPARPKLVVGLMVDQMRWDYLYRFADRYGENGFKRLLNEGFSCENTIINYVPTYTAIGHSSVYTGSVPAIHGIAGNNWIVQQTGQPMYCTQDTNVNGVGSSEKEGQQSPRNLLASTVTDELKLATNFRSKVIGIAIKDRGGILPAGHFADAAYWFESKSGHWISSTYYMEDLPQWIKDFNAQNLAEKYLKADWHPLYPIETYANSIADDNIYEGKWAGEKTPTLPRKTSELMKDAGYELIKTTPAGNTLTLDLAKAAIRHEQLGSNPTGATDFLCVSLSSTDYVGHRYSIPSVEIEDTYLRLDQELAVFFDELDAAVGKGNYTFFLTADHAVAYNPLFYTDRGGAGGYLSMSHVMREINGRLTEVFGSDKFVRSLINYQVHLDHQAIAIAGADVDKVKKEIIAVLKRIEGVAFVIDMENGEGMTALPQPLREKVTNGHNRKHSGVIQMLTDPQWYNGSPRSTGTTHGTWSPYDSHIPLVFMGWGIPHGATNKETHIVDIAPTISALLHIHEPNGNIGKPIVEALSVLR